jgi:acetate kinase
VGDADHSRELPIPDHTAGFAVMLDAFEEYGPSLVETPPSAVGHRVVQGGARFFRPTLIDDLVEINIDELSVLAPLHNPGALQGIRAARAAFPALPHVAVFDTAFHQTLPPAAYTYAIDQTIARKHRIRRYGFHGTSHKFVSEAAAAFERPLRAQAARAAPRQRRLHHRDRRWALGRHLDGPHAPGGPRHGHPLGRPRPVGAARARAPRGHEPGELDEFLNKRSGMLGLAGVSDMRDIEDRRAEGGAAMLAFDVYIHRLRAYIGAYIAQLGGVDVISFTAGVGRTRRSSARRRWRRWASSASASTRAQRGARARHPHHLHRRLRRHRARRSHQRGAGDRTADPRGRRFVTRVAPGPLR